MARLITYRFELKNGPTLEYEFLFDETHYHICPPSQSGNQPLRPWTRLEFFQCPHCPLKSSSSPQCPVARNLDRVVEDFKETLSYTVAKVTVTTPERTYVKECATQTGLRSLFGLLMASSGCPHLDWLRPLARFHLPFADIDENLFRVLSVQLLEVFLRGGDTPLQSCAKEIEERYGRIQKVNHAFMERIREYCRRDADKNALASLDVFVQMFSFQMDDSFNSLRKYFTQ